MKQPNPSPGCPFCGKKPSVESAVVGGFMVRCQEKLSHHVSVVGPTPEEAIQNWKDAFRKRHFWERKTK